MTRMTLFTISIEDINALDSLLSVVCWSKEKIKEVLPVLDDGDCCKKELTDVARVLETELGRAKKALFDER